MILSVTLAAAIVAIVAIAAGCGAKKPSGDPIEVSSDEYRLVFGEVVKVLESHDFHILKADMAKGVIDTDWKVSREYLTNKKVRRRAVATVFAAGKESYGFKYEVWKELALADTGRGDTPETSPRWSDRVPDSDMIRRLTFEADKRIKQAE